MHHGFRTCFCLSWWHCYPDPQLPFPAIALGFQLYCQPWKYYEGFWGLQ